MVADSKSVPGSPLPDMAITKDSTTAKSSSSPSNKSETASNSPGKKRSASESDPNGAPKITKRRAARACVSCRARKVRCDVVEGAPCGNCRWDNVECVVQESRRRKKNIFSDPSLSAGGKPHANQQAEASKGAIPANPVNISPAADVRRPSTISAVSTSDVDDVYPAVQAQGQLGSLDGGFKGHVPGNLLYQHRASLVANPLLLAQEAQSRSNGSPYPSIWPNTSHRSASVVDDISKTAHFLSSLEEPDASSQLPAFIRPLPSKITADDVNYLHIKGALTLPSADLQNALLRAYVEFVHPYMPLMELHDFLMAINSSDGLCGQVSLFLYQAVMFAGTAYVDMKHLRKLGYQTRKAARKVFFQKARLLFDFDYESDRLILVQSLLLMTYWYETPEDLKDTWHWMGIAISLAHTIGLHRNPAHTTMSSRKQKMWKRIWWSCFMRDRLIALGMRRPTRIKNEDFDVPMLEEGDFEIGPLADDVQVVNHDCTYVRDVPMQQELALMCIAKAKLCVCIGKMLAVQYSVLIRDGARPENTTNNTMMLHPKKQLDNLESVAAVDVALAKWVESLPACCRYRHSTPADIKNGHKTVAVQRNLLHMVYYTTISALHRPQFMHAAALKAPMTSTQSQEMSRLKVRDAAMQLTQMLTELHHLRLEKYLPTTGVTVILPAMIIHLLEMKNPIPQARDNAIRGFRQCMRVLEKLRDIYAAADYAVAFLDAALRKAAIDLTAVPSAPFGASKLPSGLATLAAMDDATTPPPDLTNLPPENAPYMTQPEADMLNAYVTQPEAARDNSPPHTDKESVTPSATGSSSSDAAPGAVDLEMDFNVDGQDEFDWNALTGANIDFDQWLQFPGDGVPVKKLDEGDASFLGMLEDGLAA